MFDIFNGSKIRTQAKTLQHSALASRSKQEKLLTKKRHFIKQN